MRDTVLESEEVKWPGKVVTFPNGGTALFESSWTDPKHISRFSTTNLDARTEHGTRIGMSLEQVPAASRPLGVELAEGVAVLMLEGDKVSARLDQAAERDFHAQFRGTGDPLRVLSPNARLIRLIAAGSCLSGSTPDSMRQE